MQGACLRLASGNSCVLCVRMLIHIKCYRKPIPISLTRFWQPINYLCLYCNTMNSSFRVLKTPSLGTLPRLGTRQPLILWPFRSHGLWIYTFTVTLLQICVNKTRHKNYMQSRFCSQIRQHMSECPVCCFQIGWLGQSRDSHTWSERLETFLYQQCTAFLSKFWR